LVRAKESIASAGVSTVTRRSAMGELVHNKLAEEKSIKFRLISKRRPIPGMTGAVVEATRDVAKGDVKNRAAMIGRRVWKILAMIFLVVGLQLNGQPADAGADGGIIVFDVPGSTCLPAFVSPIVYGSGIGTVFGPCTGVNAMNPSEVITGTYQDAVGAFHGYV